MIDSYSGYSSGNYGGTSGTNHYSGSSPTGSEIAGAQSADSYSQTSGITQSEAEAFIIGVYQYYLG